MQLTDTELDAISEQIVRFNETMLELGCDSVQVLATAIHQEDGGTAAFHIGLGNIYARRGLAQDWLNAQAGNTLAMEIAEVLPEGGEDAY